MSIINDLINICSKQNYNDPKMTFGDFKIVEKLGNGQQGVVLKILSGINKELAMKCFHPTDSNSDILAKSIERFIKEIHLLASFSHKNIVKVYAGGHACWKDNKWEIDYKFDNYKKVITENEFLFYIMDYIKGCDLTALFYEYSKNDKDCQEAKKISLSQRKTHFEELIKQVCSGMAHYNSKGIMHKDIKPENIRYSSEDDTFIIVDFGFAKETSSPQDYATIPRVDLLDLASIQERNYDKYDMFQFCKMLKDLLPSFLNDYSNFNEIQAAIERGCDSNLKKRYDDIQTFYNTIKHFFSEHWKFQLRINEWCTPDNFGKFDSKLRIPVSDSLLLFKEIRDIMDTPEFQRLRGVRQLGPTFFVFPGANHTRFEHSLGVYSLALRYVEKLISLPNFRYLCEPLSQNLKVFILSALLHDIGHYPYSHWVEEIDVFHNDLKLPRHEERAKNILNTNGELKTVIETTWKTNVQDVTNLISNSHSSNETLCSLLDSVIDIDKLDYLQRDSVHCGVNYGKGIDIERFLDSLWVDPNTKRICLTEKGKAPLLSILSARNIMFHTVYWHKTVRACEAMFKRFFFEYIKKTAETNKNDKSTIQREIETMFSKSDDDFVISLYKWADSNKNLQDMIKPFAYKGRKYIYKPAYIYFDNLYSDEPRSYQKVFRKILNMSYKDLIEYTNKFTKIMQGHIDEELSEYDIIIEKTPTGKNENYMLAGFKFYNTRKKKYEKTSGDIESFNAYLENNKQVYVFCNPKIRDTVEKIMLSNDIDKELDEIY